MAPLYQPLDSTLSQFRVLNLLPASAFEAAISCELHITSLKDKLDFEALSYVWGDLSIKKPIYVNGQEFLVTANLEAALRRLRRGTFLRRLWIDAVCINQDDKSEKSIQLCYMGRIYAESTRVVAWLGESTEYVDAALGFIDTYHAPRDTPLSAAWKNLEKQCESSETARMLRALKYAQAVRGVVEIYSRPYWTRMWTFQEFVLPREEPDVMFGSHTLKISTLSRPDITNTIRQQDGPLFEPFLRVGDAFAKHVHDPDQFGPPEFDVEVLRLWSAVNACTKFSFTDEVLYHMAEVAVTRGSRELIFSAKDPLFQLLRVTSVRACSRAHDKIYSLFGLAPAAQAALVPDYDKKLNEVMMETASYLIKTERVTFLDVFALHQGHLDETYPTWMPDFSISNLSRPSPRALWPVPGILDVFGNEGSNSWDATIGDSKLCLAGKTVGFCSEVLLQFPPERLQVAAELRRIVSEAVDSANQQALALRIRDAVAESDELRRLESEWGVKLTFDVGDNMKKKTPRAPAASRLARALVSHTRNQDQAEDLDFVSAMRSSDLGTRARHRRTPDDLEGSHAERIIERNDYYDAIGALANKVYFTTDLGEIGVGVAEIKPGDRIVLFQGCTNSPLLVRECRAEGEDTRLYKVVGTAYVQGLVKDHYLDQTLIEKLKAQEPERFVLV
jgi:hypothetical protein